MAIGGNEDRLMSDINVTPFVDVMLVLLIIFMVTAPMMVQGVNVSLPETTAEPLPSEKEHLIVTIDARGQVLHEVVDGDIVCSGPLELVMPPGGVGPKPGVTGAQLVMRICTHRLDRGVEIV